MTCPRCKTAWAISTMHILVVLSLAILLLFSFGDPQSSRYIYRWQKSVFPGREPQPRDDHTGIWRTWTYGGSKAAVVNGELHGEYVSWHDSGAVMEKGTYEHGERVGAWELFSENGVHLRSVNYRNNGSFLTEFCSNGSIRSETCWMSGKEDGEWRFYYRNGQIASIENYSLGVRTGMWTTFNELGQEVTKGEYRSGRRYSGSFRETRNRFDLLNDVGFSDIVYADGAHPPCAALPTAQGTD